jgi:hypothetical protein
LTRTDPKEVEPILNRISNSRAADEYQEPIVQLEALGLPVLPLVGQFLEKLPARHPARRSLAERQQQMGLVVGLVEFEAGSIKPDAAIKMRCERLKGVPLTAYSVATLLLDLARVEQDDISGVSLKVTREADLGGVEIVVRLLSPSSKTQGNGRNTSLLVTLGKEALLSNNIGSSSSAISDLDLGPLKEAVAKIVASPVDLPFLISVSTRTR